MILGLKKIVNIPHNFSEIILIQFFLNFLIEKLARIEFPSPKIKFLKN